jgi:hypothetical protein
LSVFLRWGVFGIVGFAALLYAYNASKRMAERGPPVARSSSVVEATASRPARPAAAETEPARTERTPGEAAFPHCEAELLVAARALEARREGEPLDRLLRIQEIAFQEGARRERLTKVATDWYSRDGAIPHPEAMRIAVISDCVRFSPPP